MKKYFLILFIFSDLLISNCLLNYQDIINSENKSIKEKIKNNIFDLEIMDIFNLPLISEKIEPVLNKYIDFKNVIKRANIKVPITDNMIPQGVTIMNSYILITAYDEINKTLNVMF